MRWALSKGAFEDVAQGLGPTPPTSLVEWQPYDAPTRVGLYKITDASLVPGGLVLYEAGGDFIDDAGFAYLPAGPTPAIEGASGGGFEVPEYHHLSGSWYRWTASW